LFGGRRLASSRQAVKHSSQGQTGVAPLVSLPEPWKSKKCLAAREPEPGD
jgi:hypothetical protein